MEIQFHDKLYANDMSTRKIRSIKKKIHRKKLKLNIYLVTLPIGQDGLLEIYWYPELLQKAYQKMDVQMIVVGIAKEREEAISLVEKMLLDVGVHEGNIPLGEYFGEFT